MNIPGAKPNFKEFKHKKRNYPNIWFPASAVVSYLLVLFIYLLIMIEICSNSPNCRMKDFFSVTFHCLFGNHSGTIFFM